MPNRTQQTLEKEKRYFVRFFRISTIGIIVTLTLFIMLFISYERWHAYTQEAEKIQKQYSEAERQVIKSRIDQIEQFLDYQFKSLMDDAKTTVKSSVLNVEKTLLHGFQKHDGQYSSRDYIEQLKNELHEIRNLSIADIDNDNHIFITALDGTSILEPNQPHLEGTNLLANPDYAAVVKEHISMARSHPDGGFVQTYIGVEDQPHVDAFTFVAANEELGVIIGTHIDRHDILYMAKHSLINGLVDIFSIYDQELIAADLQSMEIVVHKNEQMVGKNITEFPELMESFQTIMKNLQEGVHYGKISCIKDLQKRTIDEKTVYVKQFKDVGVIVSTGFFESDYNALVDEKIQTLEAGMFLDMLIAIAVIFVFGLGAVLTSLLFKRNISRSFDYFGDEIEEYQNELTRSFTIDPLTGLGNRNCLLNDINEHRNIALAILNIDDFNQINDFYGTDIGDKVLQHTARRLSEHFQSQYYRVYRLHADEFAVLQLGTDSLQNELMPCVKKMIEELRSSVETIDGLPISIHLSAGLSDSSDKPLLNADIALKTARKRNLDSVAFEDTIDAAERYKENLYWTNKVKWAIENDRFIPYFQPIFDIKKGKVKKYECLVRILDNDDKIISPQLFLETAHRSRLYSEITRIMIEKSFYHFADTDHDFSINISISDILHDETVEMLIHTIQKYNIASQLILEIIETEELEHNPKVKTFFTKMHDLGCRIALDDFGTGYSNFSYLQKLKPDFIKIDGSLIRHIDTDPHAKNIVEVIVQYAKRNNIQTIAEFVTSQPIIWKVTAIGIDYAQGYYICEPKPDIKEVPSLLRLRENILQRPVTAPLDL